MFIPIILQLNFCTLHTTQHRLEYGFLESSLVQSLGLIVRLLAWCSGYNRLVAIKVCSLRWDRLGDCL